MLVRSSGLCSLRRWVGDRGRHADVKVSCRGCFSSEPNLRLQALPTVVQRPSRECAAEVHGVSPATFIKLVLRAPSHGQVTGIGRPRLVTVGAGKLHNRVCFFRSEDRGASIADNFARLDFCEHTSARKDCVFCGGSATCAHGKRRRNCPVCAPFVKRRKRC